jgi:hypothetical protein
MICYEVYINGEKVCIAGIGEMGVLAAHLTWVKRKRLESDEGCAEGDTHFEELFVSVGGLDSQSSTHLDWFAEYLEVGDEVTFRVVEQEQSDPPQQATTECGELAEKGRRAYYEKLKKEYEEPESA